MVSLGEWFRNQNEALDFYFSFLESIMNYMNYTWKTGGVNWFRI